MSRAMFQAGPGALPNTAGFVLCGGASRRMGRDKALLPVPSPKADGTSSMLQAVYEAVRAAAGQAFLIAPAGRYAALGLPEIADLWPGEGPLGAIITGLEASKAKWNLMVAVDLPFAAPEFLRSLIQAAEPLEGVDLLLPVHSSGKREPLCAVYHQSAAPALRTLFQQGCRRVMEAIEPLATTPWPTGAMPFTNINTPEQWEALR